MELFIITLVSGFVGTSAMAMILWLHTVTGLANADMVRALGSSLTRNLNNAFWPGIIILYVGGNIYALLYTLFFQLFPVTSVISVVGLGTFVGVLHGLVFGIVMTYLDEHHPLEQFRTADFRVAFAHFVGHLGFGFMVGLIVGVSPLGAKPDPAGENLRLGEIAIQLEAYQKANELLNQVVALKPENSDAYNFLGLSYQRMGDPEQALFHYQKALQFKANHREALKNLGILYLTLDQVTRAEDHLDELHRACYFTIIVTCPQYTSLQQAIESYKLKK